MVFRRKQLQNFLSFIFDAGEFNLQHSIVAGESCLEGR
jgi:hypothetical protein